MSAPSGCASAAAQTLSAKGGCFGYKSPVYRPCCLFYCSSAPPVLVEMLLPVLQVLAFTATVQAAATKPRDSLEEDRKSTRLNSSHMSISYAVFCLKKKKKKKKTN